MHQHLFEDAKNVEYLSENFSDSENNTLTRSNTNAILERPSYTNDVNRFTFELYYSTAIKTKKKTFY